MTFAPRFLALTGILLLLGLATPPLEADTVYLKNGAWIDGVVRARGEKVVEVEIGTIGKIEIKAEDVYEIETNNRTGEETARRMQEQQTGTRIPVRNASGELVSSPGGEGANDSSVPVPPGGGGESEVDESLDPELRARIEQLIDDLQRQKTTFRTRAERQLLSIGAPAVPFLVRIAKNDFDLTRVSVFRILERVGDDRAIESAIDALVDVNEYVRDFANKTLERVTGENFGYDSNASPRWREIGQKKWQRWWEQEKAEQAASKAERAGEGAASSATTREASATTREASATTREASATTTEASAATTDPFAAKAE